MTLDDLKHLTRADGDCYVWLHGCNNGHPSMRLGGKSALVRRVLWAGTHGAIPSGKIVRATCGTDKCVNPDHMSLTTRGALAALTGVQGVMGGQLRSAAIVSPWSGLGARRA